MSSLGRTAIVLPGGGLPGLEAHAGFMLACADLGIAPVWIGGTSAGAVIGALWAAGTSAVQVRGILRGLQRADLIRRRWASYLRIKHLTSLYDATPLEAKLKELLPATFGELKIPLRVGATYMDAGAESGDWDDAEPEVFAAGDLRAAVRASLSIAGIWPYADVDGKRYSDGGTTVPYVLPRPDDFDRILIVNLFRRCDFAGRDRNIISRLLWNIEQLQDSMTDYVRETVRPLGEKVTWINLDLGTTSCLDFSPHHYLIDRSFVTASQALSKLN